MWAFAAAAQDLTIRMPATMLESGFDKQILPRFGFKHRIRVAPVAEGDVDMVLSDAPGGFRIMVDSDDRVWFLAILTAEVLAGRSGVGGSGR